MRDRVVPHRIADKTGPKAAVLDPQSVGDQKLVVTAGALVGLPRGDHQPDRQKHNGQSRDHGDRQRNRAKARAPTGEPVFGEGFRLEHRPPEVKEISPYILWGYN